MTRPISSLDVFDTLLARHSVDFRQVLQKLEIRAGLVDARVAAVGRRSDIAGLFRGLTK